MGDPLHLDEALPDVVAALKGGNAKMASHWTASPPPVTTSRDLRCWQLPI